MPLHNPLNSVVAVVYKYIQLSEFCLWLEGTKRVEKKKKKIYFVYDCHFNFMLSFRINLSRFSMKSLSNISATPQTFGAKPA